MEQLVEQVESNHFQLQQQQQYRKSNNNNRVGLFFRRRRQRFPWGTKEQQQQQQQQRGRKQQRKQHERQKRQLERQLSSMEPEKKFYPNLGSNRQSSRHFVNPTMDMMNDRRDSNDDDDDDDFADTSSSRKQRYRKNGKTTNDAGYSRSHQDQKGDTPDQNEQDHHRRRCNTWQASFTSNGPNPERSDRLLRLIGLETPVPSLFLQEAAHLFSLLSAVAMSTLRADIYGTICPLTSYIPGSPLPPVNPDELSDDIKMKYFEASPIWTGVYFLLGIARSPAHRTLYNAARPFKVIGGVSDNELDILKKANGPYAQMALCNMWLKEFISREHLNGSTGKVAPPIIGRIYQFISDGVTGYVRLSTYKCCYIITSSSSHLEISINELPPSYLSWISTDTITVERLRLCHFLFHMHK